MDCYLCKDAGRKQVAHRILPGGKGVCKDHFQGYVLTGAEPHIVIAGNPAPAADKPATAGKEKTMPAKIEIDTEKLKALHAQALSDRAIGERLGVSAATILVRRNQLGLPPGAPGHRGRGRGQDAKSASAAKRSEIASAGRDFQRRRKAGAAGTATIHLSAAGLDRLWAALSLEFKADCINHILAN